MLWIGASCFEPLVIPEWKEVGMLRGSRPWMSPWRTELFLTSLPHDLAWLLHKIIIYYI